MHKYYSVKLFFFAGILVGSLMLTACGKQNGAGGPIQSGPTEVAVMVVKPERVALTTELAGRTSAYLIAEVRPQVSGIIQNRPFNEGSDVKAGEVLYQIDPAMYQAAYANAKAALSRSEANIVAVRLRAERYKELVAINAVSRQDYDDADAALKQAEADIEANKAALETARINLAYTSVTAPISGRIGKSSVTTGALVTASQPTALAVIQKLDPVYVDVAQSSANLLRLKQNMANGKIKDDSTNKTRVKLLLEDGSPYPLEGTLKFSDVTVDPSTGSVTLRTVFPNPKHTLLPGMYVRAIIEEGANERAILVLQQGITRDSKGNPTAMVVGDGDKVELRVLKVDRSIGDTWLVSEGLKPGERVILEGVQKVRPGSTVKVVPFGAKTATTPPAGTDAPATVKK
jgi:membrane fusion protein (multidrug efflux system)